MSTISKSLVLYLFLAYYLLFNIGCHDKSTIEEGELAEGMTYTIIHTNPNEPQQVLPGVIIKALQTIQLNDSIISDMHQGFPNYQKIISAIDAQKEFKLLNIILLKARKGDTLISIQDLEQMKQYAHLPVNITGKLKTKMVILDMFDNMQDAESDRQQTIAEYKQKEHNTLREYLTAKNITVEEVEDIFIESITPAPDKASPTVSELCKDSCSIQVRYEGSSLDSIVFDENYTKQKPFIISLNTNQVIEGFEMAIRNMRVGETARAYIPSMLAYKERGSKQREIKAFQPIRIKITVEKITYNR